MATTVTYDAPHSPRVTLTKDGSVYTAVIEVEGLDPQRDTSADERRIGVRSLNPPTVRATSSRRLIDAACRAVAASATSTLGETGGPGGLAMTHFLVTRAVKMAIRALGEDQFTELPTAPRDWIFIGGERGSEPYQLIFGFSPQQLTSGTNRAALRIEVDAGDWNLGSWTEGVFTAPDGSIWALLRLPRDALFGGGTVQVEAVIELGEEGERKPVSLTFEGDHVWVVQRNRRITKYLFADWAESGAPTPLATIDFDESLPPATQRMVFDDAGNAYLTVWGEGDPVSEIWKLTPTELASSNAAFVPSVRVGGDGTALGAKGFSGCRMHQGELWVTAYDAQQVVAFGLDQIAGVGSDPTPRVTLSLPGTCWPGDILFTSDGSLFVSNFGNEGPGYEIVKFSAQQIAASGAPSPIATLSDPQNERPWFMSAVIA
jgi:hypothetical protein